MPDMLEAADAAALSITGMLGQCMANLAMTPGGGCSPSTASKSSPPLPPHALPHLRLATLTLHMNDRKTCPYHGLRRLHGNTSFITSWPDEARVDQAST